MPVLRAHRHLGGSPDRRTPRDRAPRRPPEHLRPPPGGQTLVNIPTIFSAAEQRTTTLPITSPVPGQIKAVPSYSWTFGDGLTGAGSGHPFTPSIVPNETGNNGYYVVAVYRQPGTKSITATLRWDVTFTLQGFGTITLAPIVFTDTVQLHARTARAVLVNH